jgi:hypothetical protein
VYLLLDEQTLASLSTGIVAMHGVSAKDENIDMNFSGSGIKIAVGTGAEKNTAFLLPRARNGGTSPLRAC